MSIFQILAILRGRRRSILAVMVLTLAAGAVALTLWPRQYTATASVYLDPRPGEGLTGVQQSSFPGAFLATQAEVIQSERTLVPAIRALGMDKDPKLAARFRAGQDGQGDFDSWLASRLLARLQVTPSRDASTITVAFTGPDRTSAAATVNAIVRSYEVASLAMRVEPARQVKDIADHRTDELRATLEAALARLTSYQQQNGVVATDDPMDADASRLRELSSQLVAQEDAANQSRARSSARDLLPEDAQRNTVLASQTLELARSEAEFANLQLRLGPSHPQVQQARAVADELRRRVDVETSRVHGALRARSDEDARRVSQLKNEIQGLRARILQRRSLADTAAVLRQDVENARRLYDAAILRHSAASSDSRNILLPSVTVLKHATEPHEASSPRLLLASAGTIGAAVLLALFTAALLELANRRLRSRQDIELELGIPVLLTLPAIAGTRARTLADALRDPLARERRQRTNRA